MNIIRRLSVIFLFIGSAFLIQTCNEDDLGPKEVLLTLNIEPDYFPGNHDTWIFISDRFGKTIDVRQANDSTQIKFLGAPRNSMTLTIFRQASYWTGAGTYNSFGFESYQEIASGSIIELKKPPFSNQVIPDVIGSAPFTLMDYNDSNKPEEALAISDGTAMPYTLLDYNSDIYSGTTFSSQLFLRDDPSRILLTTYRNDIPVYLWLNDVIPGEDIEVSFNSFQPSLTIPINKQIAVGHVKTMNGNYFSNGYMLCELYGRQLSKSSNLSQLPKLGYLDGFEKYFVSVALNLLHFKDNIYYTKIGTIPASITLPNYTLLIRNDNLNSFSMEFSNDYTHKLANFRQVDPDADIGVYWNLTAADGENFKTPSIPSKIKKLYPMLSTDGLRLWVAAYTHCLDGYTYEEYVRDYLRVTRRDEYEELRYTIVN